MPRYLVRGPVSSLRPQVYALARDADPLRLAWTYTGKQGSACAIVCMVDHEKAAAATWRALVADDVRLSHVPHAPRIMRDAMGQVRAGELPAVLA